LTQFTCAPILRRITRCENPMEIGAGLHHVQLLSPDPQAVARFYGQAYAMPVEAGAEGWACTAADRRLLISQGTANRLGFAAFAFADAAALQAHRKWVASRAALMPNRSPLFDPAAFAVSDPDGNVVLFGHAGPTAPNDPEQATVAGAPPPARLQHCAIRSPQPATLMAFYRDALGFVVSDRVEDETGRVRACFLRTDTEHHALAIFDAPQISHDHLSFETRDWTAVRDWADRMSSLHLPLVWGVGRHGPGNDVFFMIRDPDGNLAEISAELEVCAPGRAEGLWPHEQRTLNRWGMAIMRS
jgi:catechol 2,3-dioxygenase-like lactoylglutathione lyase family enzyme